MRVEQKTSIGGFQQGALTTKAPEPRQSSKRCLNDPLPPPLTPNPQPLRPPTGKEDPAKKGLCSNFLCDAPPGTEIMMTGPAGKILLMPEVGVGGCG